VCERKLEVGFCTGDPGGCVKKPLEKGISIRAPLGKGAHLLGTEEGSRNEASLSDGALSGDPEGWVTLLETPKDVLDR
jgi:hypothetical protein